MKTISTLLFLFISIISFGQTTSCCSKVITTKTNKPFDCLKNSENKQYTQAPPTGNVVLTGNIFSGGTYGYQGNLVKVFTMYPPQGSADLPVSYLVLDDACNVICGWADCCGIAGPVGFDPNNGCRVDFTKNAIPISGF